MENITIMETETLNMDDLKELSSFNQEEAEAAHGRYSITPLKERLESISKSNTYPSSTAGSLDGKTRKFSTLLRKKVGKGDSASWDQQKDSVAGESSGCITLSPEPKSKPFESKSYSIKEGKELVISRTRPSGDCPNLCIFDCKVLSREHASLLFSNGNFYVKDLKSSNGTSLNEVQVVPEVLYKLAHNDVVQFGQDVSNEKFEEKCIIARVKFDDVESDTREKNEDKEPSCTIGETNKEREQEYSTLKGEIGKLQEILLSLRKDTESFCRASTSKEIDDKGQIEKFELKISDKIASIEDRLHSIETNSHKIAINQNALHVLNKTEGDCKKTFIEYSNSMIKNQKIMTKLMIYVLMMLALILYNVLIREDIFIRRKIKMAVW